MSRRDIAASLGAKDPSWFRQTSDRGIGSAAYRKNDADADMATSLTSRGMKLPGLSSEERFRTEPEKPPSPASPHKAATALPLELRQTSNTEEAAFARPVSLSTSSKSPTLDLPTFKPLDLTTPSEPDSAGLGRTPSILSSAGRPPSPTKGLGGFVQSAMMKRSDSVSKRWSVQANAGLKRGDSVATSRPPHLSGASGFTPGHSRASSKDTRGGNSSPLSSSRPVSSHGSEPVPITKGRPLPRSHDEPAESPVSQPTDQPDASADRPESIDKQHKNRPITPPQSDLLLARSPSKTMDPRRWSPTKASWLESALNKPDSPRFTPVKPETPVWKLNMQRSKMEQQSHSSDPTAVALPKPAAASKSLSSPPLSAPTTDKRILSDRENPKSTLQEIGDVNPPAAGMTRVTAEKTDDKPAIPSKRNITPAQMGSTSNEKPKDELSSSSQVKGPGSGHKSRNLDTPESPTESKPVLKPKPQTPPKIDFRASLKSRQAAPSSGNGAEPEFKAVFGKLKRTQTQNYVAPDLLKDNITKGKASLNVTGGPQQTKRVDEFKESILQKKEAIKATAGSTVKLPEPPSTHPKAADAVPEALARRMTLHKTGPSSEKLDPKRTSGQASKPSAPIPKPQPIPEKPSSLKKDIPPVSEQPPVLPPEPKLFDHEPSGGVQATVLSVKMETPSRWQETQAQQEPEAVEPTPEPTSEPSFKSKALENSKIAARLNPALAGLLSRSGSPRLLIDQSTNSGGQLPVRETQQLSRENTNDDTGELTHMTKARARGPKRRAPKGSSLSKQTADNSSTKTFVGSKRALSPPTSSQHPTPIMARTLPLRSTGPKPSPIKPGMEQEALEPTGSQPAADRPSPLTRAESEPEDPKPAEKSGNGLMPTKLELVKEADPAAKPKPAVANKSAELRKVSNPGTASRPPNSPAPVKPLTPKNFDVLPDRPKFVSSPPESDNERRIVLPTPPFTSSMPLTPSKSKLNTPKAPKPPVDNSAKPATTTPSSKVSGLGLQLGSASKKPIATTELTPPPEPEVIATRMAKSPGKAAAPTNSTSSVKPQLESFFGVLTTREKAEFDTHAFLSSQNEAGEKNKTLHKQIWEVSGDGKRINMPPQQDYILFEDSMYLCVHSMESPSGLKSSEVYLWCGDEVPAAAIEDAQLFCRKVARDNNAKLEVIKQGKESSEFFQALGGIVITRRNKSSALYMLCGKRHLGHISFDEVDLSASSLCSGLPFLISAKFGKLYLWKGIGSNQEDVGCARLIGMDMGLTGEIEEVSEGEEPDSFWESFPSRLGQQTNPSSKNHANQPRGHAPKLYRIEHDRPKSSGGFWGLRSSSPPKQATKALVEEITPFCQRDLDDNHIHILDTYGELYV